MVSLPIYGRSARGGGTVQSPGRTQNQTVPAWALAQSPPSVVKRAPRYAPPQVSPVARPYTAFGQSGAGPWRGAENANDGLIFRDRHGSFRRGTAVTGTTEYPGASNVLNAGPVRPDFNALNRTWNWQVGTGQAYTDDPTRGYGVAQAGARRFYYSSDDVGGWHKINGGTPGFYRNGPGGVPMGDPSQGPGMVFSGPPHGLHTHYPPDNQQTLATFRARPQMVPARVDRLSNSRIAGQNYSQWTQHQGGGRQ